MPRLTRPAGAEGGFLVDREAVTAVSGGYTGEAVRRLAAFEDLHDELLREQGQLAAKLEELRGQGKMKSARFKELLGKKLMNAAMLTLLKSHGVDSPTVG